MAAVTDTGAVSASTANQSTYASASFNPAVDDLLVVLVAAAGTTDAGEVTVSANGITSMTQVGRAATGVHTVYMFVADQLATGTASMTVTFDCTGDAATGAIVMVARVSGMSKTGTEAIKQFDLLENGTGGTTPEFVFGASCQTGNPTLVVLGQVSGAGSVEPTGWTEAVDTSIATPTWGGTYVFRDSGFTGTTITWGDTETAHGGVAVELDASTSGVTGTGAAAFGGTFTASGVPETFGVAAAAFGGTFTASGVPETFGVAAAAFGGTFSAQGIDRALGVAVALLGFTGDASGVAGAPPVLGQGAAAFGPTNTASGLPRHLGQAAASFGGTFTASGIPETFGTAVASLGFTGVASGVPETFGLAVANLGFTGAASGVPSQSPPVFGVAVASFGFTGTANGKDRALGVAVATFVYTGTAQGKPRHLGVASATFSVTGTANGNRVLYKFSPPTHEEPIKIRVGALDRFRLTYAKTILRRNGTFISVRTPNPTWIVGEPGVDYFIGGYEYEITAVTKAELEAAGFTV